MPGVTISGHTYLGSTRILRPGVHVQLEESNGAGR